MASLIYNSALEAEAKGMLRFTEDSYKVMLVSDAYKPDQKRHSKRSQVNGEISGAGYGPGGSLVIVNVTKDDATNRVDVSLGGAQWVQATIAARGAVYYRARGTAPDQDELVAYIDFGKNVVSVNGDFVLTESTIRKQN